MKRVKVRGFENYEVDEGGIVYRKDGKIVKPYIKEGRECRQTFYRDGGLYFDATARVVWESFHDVDLDSNTTVLHKDGDLLNNALSNLELGKRGARKGSKHEARKSR